MGINSPIQTKKFEKFLIYVGCVFVGQKGSHMKYDRSDLRRPIIFPAGKETYPSIIRSNLRTLGISTDEFEEILKEI